MLVSRPQEYKTFFMLNLAESENFSANKHENANPAILAIFIFISREIFMLSFSKKEFELLVIWDL